MSKWSGKYVIGLTGNIATGKSVVRKMLEHLGAYGIDADALAHRVIARGAPGYQPVLSTFGSWVLGENSEIDRQKLGRLVFNNPDALTQLEKIIHPYVNQAIDLIVRRASQHTIVIEAIKLLETDLAAACDTLWTTFSPEKTQVARLMEKRHLTEADALARIRAQSPQQDKLDQATVIIQNVGSFEDTWHQVQAAWKVISSITESAPVRIQKTTRGELSVKRGRPGDSQAIATLITRLSNGLVNQDVEDIMAAFGEKAFLLLSLDKDLVGMAAWQVENLVARTTDIYVDIHIALPGALKALMNEVESASQDLQSEASLLFLSPQLAGQSATWKELGYEMRTTESLGIQAWQDAVKETMPANTTLYFKQLRHDRILRPI